MTASLPAPETRYEAFRRDVRDLPRTAWVIYAGTFINRFGSFVLTFLVLILVKRGYSPAEAGIAASAYGVGSVAAAMVGGQLADRFGRRRTIALSMFSGAAVILLLWRAQALPAIIALAALAGMTGELYRPAAAALLADVTPAGRRVVTFALYRLAVNAGFALGPAVAGYLAASSFTIIFIGDAVTCALYGVLVLAAVPRSFDRPAEAPARRREGESAARGPSALRMIAADRALLSVLLASVAIGFVYHQSTVTMALEVDARGLPTSAYGFLASLNGAICLLLELPVAAVTARAAAWIPLAVGAALTGAGFGGIALASTFWALAAMVLVWSLGEIVQSPVSQAFVADLAPPGLQGRYQAAFGFTHALGLVLAPALGPALFAWSRPGLWAICAILGAAASLTYVALGRTRAVHTVEADLAKVAVPAE
ncbi:MAG TPA: MFS transporter [Longimicrobium sp.]|nr:MFS transporter [Longimicrobium sp.]